MSDPGNRDVIVGTSNQNGRSIERPFLFRCSDAQAVSLSLSPPPSSSKPSEFVIQVVIVIVRCLIKEALAANRYHRRRDARRRIRCRLIPASRARLPPD